MGKFFLPKEVEEALYRIAQEAVNNTLRHARASKVMVNLVLSETQIRLSIKDDGRGFDLQSVGADRMGLRNIERWAAEIQARYTIDTAPGFGTNILIERFHTPES